MNRIFSLLFFLSLLPGSQVAAENYYLIVERKTTTSAVAPEASTDEALQEQEPENLSSRFALSEQPSITLEGHDMVVTTSEQRFSIPRQEVRRWWIGIPSSTDPTVGIATAHKQHIPTLTFTSERDLVVEGIAPATPVAVFDLQGRQLSVAVLREQGRLELRLSSLPKGVYVVKVDQQTIKIQHP